MKRKLFCEISPLTYWISKQKNIILRNIKNLFININFAKEKSHNELPYVIFEHKSVIRRVLDGVDMQLQENKAVNLSLAVPKVNGVLIYPNQVFSFWELVGKCTASKGYKTGLTISNSYVKSGIGGGMCQFTNLLHYMFLHSPLEIVEHHHHDGFDLFPDFERKVPFGTGTSITYNYLDYRVKNTTDKTFQIIVYTDDTHLCGKLLCNSLIDFEYTVKSENEHFIQQDDGVYRKGEVYRICKNKNTKEVVFKECIRKNYAKVMYNTQNLEILKKD